MSVIVAVLTLLKTQAEKALPSSKREMAFGADTISDSQLFLQLLGTKHECLCKGSVHSHIAAIEDCCEKN